MAVKNGSEKVYAFPADVVSGILRHPDFSQCLEAAFIEEAILPEGTEFRYVRKSTRSRYGRNYYIRVKTVSEQQTGVTVTTQSRKVTVLFDTEWKKEVQRAFGYLDMLLRR